MLTLADVSTVRERGALDAPPASGSVTDKQVEAAIVLASHTMITEACGFALYLSVKDMTDEDKTDTTIDAVTGRTNAQKFNDFLDAECYFTLAHLEQVVQTGKMSETGTPMSYQIGRESRTFAPQDEIANTRDGWIDMAYTCLKPYFTLLGVDTEGAPTFVANKKMTMMMSII